MKPKYKYIATILDYINLIDERYERLKNECGQEIAIIDLGNRALELQKQREFEAKKIEKNKKIKEFIK